MSTATARRSTSVFESGRNQCVRIPKDLRFPDNVKRVEIAKIGDEVILRPLKTSSWRAFLAKGPNPDFEPDRTPIASGEKFFAEYMADLEQK